MHVPKVVLLLLAKGEFTDVEGRVKSPRNMLSCHMAVQARELNKHINMGNLRRKNIAGRGLSGIMFMYRWVPFFKRL